MSLRLRVERILKRLKMMSRESFFSMKRMLSIDGASLGTDILHQVLTAARRGQQSECRGVIFHGSPLDFSREWIELLEERR
jgi:hypothetical protein